MDKDPSKKETNTNASVGVGVGVYTWDKKVEKDSNYPYYMAPKTQNPIQKPKVVFSFGQNNQ